MAYVFVSYRRADSTSFALRIVDRLSLELGKGHVFIDVEELQAGDEFPKELSKTLARANACVVVIGPQWCSITGADGRRRLDDPADYVLREIRLALDRHALIIPVLVDGARMPSEEELPAEIRELARFQAVVLSSRTFNDDIEYLLVPLRNRGPLSVFVPAFMGPFIGSSLSQLLREVTTPERKTNTAPQTQPAAAPRGEEAVILLGTMILWAGTSFGLGLATRSAFRQRTRDVAQMAILVCIGAAVTRLVVLGVHATELFELSEDFLHDQNIYFLNKFLLENMFRALVFWTLAAASVLLSGWRIAELSSSLKVRLALCVGVAGAAGILFGALVDRAQVELLRRLEIDWTIPGTFEFPFRCVMIASAMLWALRARTSLPIVRQIRMLALIFGFGLVASVASGTVARALGFQDAWGFPNGVMYGVFVPLAIRYVIDPLRRPAQPPSVAASAGV
jgi:hypothetical protein